MKKAIIFVLVVVVSCIVAGYIWFNRVADKIFIAHTKTGTQQESDTTIEDHLAHKTPFTVLFLGYGGGSHDGTYLTDSIIAVHVDPKTQKVFLISIPRDTWVKIPTTQTESVHAKINAAYSIGLNDKGYPDKKAEFSGEAGGGKLAEYVVSQVVEFPIQYFVSIDFSGFTSTIDTLGGVDITVERAFDDYQYPIAGKEVDPCGLLESDIATFSAAIATKSATELEAFPCRFEHLHFDSGKQYMNGATALKYTRSRYSAQDGNDFGRAQRQRNLLVAVKEKVISIGFIPKIIPFMSSLGDDVRTDLTPDDSKTIIENASSLSKYQVISLALTDQNYLKESVSSSGQSILSSRNGMDNWKNVHTWLANEFSGKPQSATALVKVVNGTPTAGLALQATNLLNASNIETVAPATASQSNVTKTTITIYEKTIPKADLDTIKKQIGVNTVTVAPKTQNEYNVLVTIGTDYKSKR